MPYTRGSAGAWRFLYQLFKHDNHPVAIVCNAVPDPSVVQGAILAGIPVVCEPESPLEDRIVQRPARRDRGRGHEGCRSHPLKGDAQCAAKTSRVLKRDIRTWSEFVGIIQGWHGFRKLVLPGPKQRRWSLKPTLSRHIEVSNVSKGRVDPSGGAHSTNLRSENRPSSSPTLRGRTNSNGLPSCSITAPRHACWILHGRPTLAAFFALERAIEDSAIWAINLPLLWDTHSRYRIGRMKVSTRTA
jgi:hypothetical protein